MRAGSYNPCIRLLSPATPSSQVKGTNTYFIWTTYMSYVYTHAYVYMFYTSIGGCWVTEKPLQIFLGLCMCIHMLTERKNTWGLENKMLTPVGVPFSKMPHVIFSPWKNKNKSLIFMLCNTQGHKALPESGLPQLCLRFRYCPWHWVTLHLML